MYNGKNPASGTFRELDIDNGVMEGVDETVQIEMTINDGPFEESALLETF